MKSNNYNQPKQNGNFLGQRRYRTAMSDYFELPNTGLKAYLGHVKVGNSEVYRGPFGAGESVDDLLKSWEKHLNTIKRQWPTLLDFENDLRKKVGPMSIMKPLSERMEDIEHYYDDILLPSKPISPSALALAATWFNPLRRLKIQSQGDTLLNMKLSTNSGSPYFRKRRDVIEESLPCRILHDVIYTHSGRNPRLYIPAAVLGWRGQEGGMSPDDVKQRVVWMFPFQVNVEELRLYQPLIRICQEMRTVPAWVSMDAVDETITDLFRSKGPDDLIVCTDFSKFDQHFNEDMQRAARQLLTVLFEGDPEWEYWDDNIFDIKYTIPLCYAWNKFKRGRHGMGSGSGGTNADETLVHKALQFEAAFTAGQELNPHSQCLGDDGILTYPGITVEHVVETYSQHGQEMNIDKQYASADECIYLRRWHHKDYIVDRKNVGVYSTYRAIGRLCYQERFYDPKVWGAQVVAIRQLSIIENVKYHPLREQFADWCMERDKFRLGLDIPGFMDNLERHYREITQLIPDLIGYTKSQQIDQPGINSWWIVNYLRSKR